MIITSDNPPDPDNLVASVIMELPDIDDTDEAVVAWVFNVMRDLTNGRGVIVAVQHRDAYVLRVARIVDGIVDVSEPVTTDPRMN